VKRLGGRSPSHFVEVFDGIVAARIRVLPFNAITTCCSLVVLISQVSFCAFVYRIACFMYCCFTFRILDEHENPIDVLWNDTLIYYSGYTYESLEPIVEKFCSLIIKSETSKYQVSCF
jgi:hypothetical protein